VREAIAGVLDRTTFGQLAERQRDARPVEAYAI